MRRIYENNDLEFDNPYSGSTLKFFTTSQAYNVTKSGDTITLTWDELNSMGKGVLQYIALDSCNEKIVSTEFYIMADKVIIDDVEKDITTAEMLKEEIDAKVSNIVDGDVDLSVKMNTDLTTVDGLRSVALGRGLDLKASNSFAAVGGVFTFYFYGSGTTYQICTNKPKASVTINDKYYYFGAGAPLYVGATIYTTSLQPIAKILTAEQNAEKPWIMDITTDNVLSETLLNWERRFALVSQHTEGTNNINMGVFNDIKGSRSYAIGDANRVLTDNSTVIGDSNTSTKQSNYIFGANNVVNPSVEDNRMNITVGALNYTNSPQSLIFGVGNTINDQNTYATLVGFGLKTNAEQQPIFICGQHNDTNYDANTRFVVGGGTKETSRKNLLTIKDDGTVLNINGKEFVTKDAYDELKQAMIDNEETIAAALNDLNNRLKNLES